MTQYNQQNIIILETNPSRRNDLRSLASDCGYTPFSFEKETVCLENLAPIQPCLVISRPHSLEGTIRFINTVKMINYNLPVLIISDDHAILDFVSTNGFSDVLIIETSFEPSEIKDAINKIQVNRLQGKTLQDYPLIIGQSPDMIKIKKMLSELSLSKEPVLIQGETGTGKDLIAKAIHCRLDTNNSLFFKMNAAKFSRELFDDEPSGDSTRELIGRSGENNSKFKGTTIGTIFLDKIEQIPVALQGNLLHVLEDGGNSKFGFDLNVPSNVRIIASANGDLNQLVESGKFRKDLFFRLNILPVKIPPLRKRIEDIPLLTDYFIDKTCLEHGKSYYEMSKKTKDIFSWYHWPGNVKELYIIIKNAIMLGNEIQILDQLDQNNQTHDSTNLIDGVKDAYGLLELSHLKQYLMDLNKVSLKDICRKFIARTEKNLMKKALEKTNWNRKKAANLLDISYKSMLNKIKAYNIT